MISGKILGKTYCINGVSVDVSEFNPDVSTDIYYEVVRIIDGKALFLEDHLIRLQKSILNTDLTFPGTQRIIAYLSLLLRRNEFKIGNIRICLQKDKDRQNHLLCYFVPFVYPETSFYLSGVHLVTYPHIRPNPGIKKWDNSFRVSVNQYIRDKGVYEALLLNDQNQITEGSRSNLFFIDRNQQLITPPEKDILPGITRKYVLRICEQKEVKVIESPVSLKDLGQMESCFITGTSPKILPVCQVDEIKFMVNNSILQMLMSEFEIIIEENLTILNKDY